MDAMRLRVARFLCVTLLGLLLLQACNLPLGSTTPPVTYKVGASGNEIKHPGGVKVVVPLGSLKGDAEISVGLASEDPPLPEGSVPVGRVYQISLSKGAEMLFPLEIYLPLERKPGQVDAQFGAMRWDGQAWTLLQGQVEGDLYHFTSEHTTLFRLNYFEAVKYPIEFINDSMTKVHIYPWRYETFTYDSPLGGILIDGRYPDGTSRGWGFLPPGVYDQWCVDWSQFTKPVWDIFGGGYWTEFIGNFHFIFSQIIILNRYSEIEGNKPNTARVRFSIGAAEPGLCGQSPDVGRTNPKNPLRELPMPWTTLEPARTSTAQRSATVQRSNTPARSSTPQRSATPLRSDTPRPSSTPLNTPTSALNFSNYIVSSLHIDRLEPLVIVLAHDQDYVVLTGPITVQYEYWHRASASDPLIKDPRVTVVIKSGENHKFLLYDLYGLNDIYLYLISSP